MPEGPTRDAEITKVKAMLKRLRADHKEGGVCADDNICPPDITASFELDGKTYTRVDPVLVCTRPDSHEGDHQAEGFEGVILYQWPRGRGRAL